jgi:hypothetical protein
MNLIKNKYLILMIIAIGFFITSCENYLDVNEDPNQATTSDIKLQLSAAQLTTAIGFGQRI